MPAQPEDRTTEDLGQGQQRAQVTDTDPSAGGSKVQVESEEIVTSGGKTYTRRRHIWVNPETAEKINRRRQATDWARSLGNYLPLYFVGNFVRDKYLKRVSESIDIVAIVPLPEVAKMLDRLSIHYKVSDDRQALLLVMDNMEMRITAMDGNKLVEQLSRSDFTLNSIAQSVSGNFYDPFSGLSDIKNKVLRSPYGNSKHAFRIDPARIIRAAMYIGEFGFKPHPTVIQGISAIRSQLSQTDPEKIGEELDKIMTCKRPEVALEFLANHDLLGFIDPAFADMVDMPQNQPKHMHDVWKHTLTVAKRAKSEDLILNLAILFHNIGKTQTANEDFSQFPDYETKSAAMTIEILNRLGFDSDVVRRTANLVKYHNFLCDDADRASTADYRKVRLSTGTDMQRLVALTYANKESCRDNDTSSIERAVKRLRALDIPSNVKTLSPLSSVDIEDDLDITGGSLVAEIQDHLHEMVMLDELQGGDKEGALKEAKKYINDIHKSLDDIIGILDYEST